MDKILTIIIPTYNMEKYLRHCLDSLIVPNMDRAEVLVVNDGSKDSSSAIAHEYQDKYPQTFRVIDKENGNYGSCINRGLKEATGKYVKVLDADDSFDNKSFQKYLDFIPQIDVDLILNDNQIVDPEDHEGGLWSVNVPQNKIIENPLLPVTTQMHNVAYKTENLKKIGYSQTEGISYTDQEWMFWPMSTVKTAYYLPIPLYRYLIGREGQTIDPKIHLKSVHQELKVLERQMSLWEKYHDSWKVCYKNMTRRLAYRAFYMFDACILKGNKDTLEAFRALDQKSKHSYPCYYKESKKFPVSQAIAFPFLRYWRLTGTIFPKQRVVRFLLSLRSFKEKMIKK